MSEERPSARGEASGLPSAQGEPSFLRRPLNLRRRLRACGRLLLEHPAVALVALTLFSAVLHFHLFNRSGSFFTMDSPAYLASARSLAAGHGFLDEAGKIEARRTPGYPLFLALLIRLGLDVRGMILLQHLLALALPFLVYQLALLVSGRRNTALLAALVITLDPGHLILSNLVMTELVTSLLLLALFYFLLRARERFSLGHALAAGAAAGCCALVKPAALYLFVPLALWLWLASRSRRKALLASFLAASLLLPLGWIARNKRLAGVASLSSISGEILYYFRAAGTVAFDRTGFEYAPVPLHGEESFRYQFFRVVQKEFTTAARVELEAHYGRPLEALSEIERSSYLGDRAWSIITSHRRGFVDMTINGALHMVFDGAWTYAGTAFGGMERVVLIWLMLATNVIFFFLAGRGLWRLKRDGRGAAAALIVVMAVYFVALHAGPEQEQWRYRIPLIPLYAILIAAGMSGPRSGSVDKVAVAPTEC